MTDTADALSSDASIPPTIAEVVCTLDVTDDADTVSAECTITGTAIDDSVRLGGRNPRLFDVPFRRVKADLSVTDDDDQLYAEAKVSQLMKRLANLSVQDADDLMDSSANVYWVQPTLIRKPQVKLISSRYAEAVL